jgi:molecular chaperone HtpG
VTKYADFITYQILHVLAAVEATTPAAPLNSMKPIWTRPAADVGEDDYAEFYRHVSRD